MHTLKSLFDLLCDFQPGRIMESLMWNLPPHAHAQRNWVTEIIYIMITYGPPAEQGFFLVFFFFSLRTSLAMILSTEPQWTHWLSRMISTTASCIPCCNQATGLCISAAFWDTPGKCAENVNSRLLGRIYAHHVLYFIWWQSESFSCHLNVTHDECAAFAPGPHWCFVFFCLG